MNDTPYRMIAARHLEPGPALVVVSLPGATVRGVVARVQRGWTETVRVQFTSGAELILQESAMIGLVDQGGRRRRRLGAEHRR
jgi:hypothetical protein